jgi:hypothetical protein
MSKTNLPPVAQFSVRRIFIVCLLGWLAFSIGGAFAVDAWQHRQGQPLVNAGFGYGVLIHAIDTTGQYRVCDIHYPGVCFSAHRLPLIPAVLMGLRAIVGDDLARIGLAKALLFNILIALSLWIVLDQRHRLTASALIILGLPLMLPMWGLTVLELSVEEAYIIPVLTLLFAVLWFSRALTSGRLGVALGAGTLGGILIGLKNSMPYWALAIPLIVALRSNSWRRGVVALAPILLALVALALFNEHVSQRFTIGSSWEGWNLFKGNNPKTADIYPWQSLDRLDYEGYVKADRPLKDEWDYNDYFRQKALDFIRAHPADFLQNSLTKAWVLLFEIRRTGRSSDQPEGNEAIRSIQSVMLFIFRISLWTAIILAVRLCLFTRITRSDRAVPLGFLLFLALYGGFYIIGFAYERHVMPIVTPTVLFLFWCFTYPPANATLKLSHSKKIQHL